MYLSPKTFVAAGFAAAMFAATSASAASISFSDSSPLTSTLWSDTLTVSQFDTSLGTLTGVELFLSGTVQGSGGAESLDASPSTITLNLSADIVADLIGFGTTNEIEVTPIASDTRSVTAFDGTDDKAGTSGFTTGTISSSDNHTKIFTTDVSTYFSDTTLYELVADFSFFEGSGTFDIGMTATGASTATGPGNVSSIFNTSAGSELTVTYTYDPAVIPLPAGAWLMLAGAGALAATRRKKKA